MAQQYGFTKEQKDHLGELLRDENNQLWSVVLYGIGYSDNQIVTVALSQDRELWRFSLLGLVWLQLPCGMVRLLCKLVCQ